MKSARLCMLLLAVAVSARADFSCTTEWKSNGKTDVTIKHYLKGQRMMTDMAARITILDFDAKTHTTIDKTMKTYSVRPLSQTEPSRDTGAQAQFNAKETGQHKTINGFNASQMVMSMQMDMGKARGGMKMEMEAEVWYSAEIPGAKEVHDFYRRNWDLFPWATEPGGGRSGMGKAMLDLQKQMAAMNGYPVLYIVHMKVSGGDPRMAAAMAGFNDTTVETGRFSTATIPDSVFAIPAGYTKVER